MTISIPIILIITVIVYTFMLQNKCHGFVWLLRELMFCALLPQIFLFLFFGFGCFVLLLEEFGLYYVFLN